MMQKAKTCRLGTPCTPRTPKQALACRTQHHPTLSIEEIADQSDVPVSWLYRWANDNEGGKDIPAKALARVAAVTGAWDLFDFYLAPHGMRVVAFGRTAARSLVSEVMDAPVATGRLVEVAQRAVSDGRVDDDEEREIRQHTRDVRKAMDDIDSVLDNGRQGMRTA